MIRYAVRSFFLVIPDKLWVKRRRREKGENHHRADSTDTQIEDDRVWIGDATWEERIWKDLIKIREEMFWARVGGFRDR